jgi:cytochrome P450
LPLAIELESIPLLVHYDKEVFGDDAEIFNPERWIEDDAVQMEKAMLQFGAGTRTCIGKKRSYLP